MLSLVMVDLMDWHCRMHDVRLNSFWYTSVSDMAPATKMTGADQELRTFVHNGLNVFMDVMVNPFASDGGFCASRLLALYASLRIAVLRSLILKRTLYSIVIVMFERAFLNTDFSVMVLLRQSFAVLYRLLRRMIMVLMDLTVYHGNVTFVLGLSDRFILNCRCCSLMHRGIMLAMASTSIC